MASTQRASLLDPNEEFVAFWPIHTHTFGIPQERDLLITYEVYKPTPETEQLKSEKGRHVFAEAFIENINLGTLSDLCVRSLAQGYGTKEHIPLVMDDPLKQRIHYDTLDVELPLEECYLIDDEKYWERVVLAKNNDDLLKFKKSANWKELGIALKYTELVEQCPAEYWPEEEMEALAQKVKPFITELHLSKLTPMNEHSFAQYIDSESSDDESEDGEEEDEVDSATIDKDTEHGDEEFDEQSSLTGTSHSGEVEGEEEECPESGSCHSLRLSESEKERLLEEQWEAKELMKAKKAEHEAEQAEEERAKELRKRMKKYRKEHYPPPPPPKPPTPPPTPKKKGGREKQPKEVKIASVMDIPIEEDEYNENPVYQAKDKRNLAELLYRKKKYKYPAKDCHHINLRFLRNFDNLTTFTITFEGVSQDRDYNDRIFNFSYNDVFNLAEGVRHLPNLKVFRFVRSRMDANKLSIIVDSLRYLPSIEVIDFSYDQLKDDCGWALKHIFEGTDTIHELELDGNELGSNSIVRMSLGLKRYAGKLEYLGLGHCHIDEVGLDCLANAMLDNDQVTRLNLAGIITSQDAIKNVIANQILRHHEPISHIDLTGVTMEEDAATELVKALRDNLKISHLDIKGCNMPLDIETDVAVLLQRNHYVADNPYIGDETKTAEEIEEFVSRVKNPILLAALATVEKEELCLKQQSSGVWREPSVAVDAGTLTSLDNIECIEDEDNDATSQDNMETLEHLKRLFSFKDEPVEPFEYDANHLTEDEFKKYIYLPGPNHRYYYIQQRKKRNAFRYN